MTSKTNRPTPDDKGKRVVWKPALSTPFSIKWPQIPGEVAENLLAELLKLLDGQPSSDPSQPGQPESLSISEYKSRLRSIKQSQTRKKKNPTLGTANEVRQPEISGKTRLSVEPETPCLEKGMPRLNELPQRPPLLKYIFQGINDVAKELESEIQQTRQIISEAHTSTKTVKCSFRKTEEATDTMPEIAPVSTSMGIEKAVQGSSKMRANPAGNQLSLIFVCTEDLNPISLVDHLLPTVAALNENRLLLNTPAVASPALMIPLLKGAESRIATSLGIKNAAVVGLRGNNPQISGLYELAEKFINPILPPNHVGSKDQPPKDSAKKARKNSRLKLIPTHVKHFKTTAPMDMRKHQLERSNRKKELRALKSQQNDSHRRSSKKIKTKRTMITKKIAK